MRTNTSNTSQTRRLDIQGLRAVAVLVVVAFHVGLPVPGGFVGVDVFLVISGFVITSMLQREWSATGRLRLSRFYVRRFMRLTPALALLVVVVIAASALILSPLGTQQTAAKTGVGAMLLVANVVIARTTGGYFDAPADTNPLLNTWSLSVEEQFYFVFPALIGLGWLVARRRPTMRWTATGLVAAIAGISFGLAVIGSSGASLPAPVAYAVGFYSPLSRAWEFAAGALLAISLGRFRPMSRTSSTAIGMTGMLLLGSSLWLISATTRFPGLWTLLPVIATVLVIAAGSDRNAPVPRLLSSGPLVKIGDWSYSIYLWHWPFIVFAALLWPRTTPVLLIAALASLGPAVASYTYLEQPIRMSSATSGPPLAKLVMATLAPPIIFSAGLWVASQNSFWSSDVATYQAAVMPTHAGRAAGCLDGRSPDLRVSGSCTWNTEATGPPLYLVGDSNAEHFSESAILAGRQLGRPVVIATASACPFVSLEIRAINATPARNQQCTDYRAATLNYLLTATPGLIIISNIDSYWGSPVYAAGRDDASVTVDTQEKLAALREGLSDTVTRLQKAGHKVLLIQTVPQWKGDSAWAPDRCTFFSVLSRDCRQDMTVAAAESRQGSVRQVVKEVAVETGASELDTWPLLCDATKCSTETDGLIRYRDSSHITVMQSEALAEVFADAITSTR